MDEQEQRRLAALFDAAKRQGLMSDAPQQAYTLAREALAKLFPDNPNTVHYLEAIASFLKADNKDGELSQSKFILIQLLSSLDPDEDKSCGRTKHPTEKRCGSRTGRADASPASER